MKLEAASNGYRGDGYAYLDFDKFHCEYCIVENSKTA